MKDMKKKLKKQNFPIYCDFSCKYASFADRATAGDCRREVSIYCKHFKKYNSKNSKCLINRT